MGFFGRFFGGGALAPEEVVETGPDPVPVPVVPGDVAYVGHADAAIDRLPEQFKRKAP